MMMSLFSIFDPSVYSYISSWFIFFIFLLILVCYWSVSQLKTAFFVLLSNISKEFYSNIKFNVKNGLVVFIFSGFFFIFLINYVSLYPSNFTVSGHLVFSLFFSLCFWVSLNICFLSLNMHNYFVHLVPTGTPLILISFMVFVEMVSNLIRPITLSVRLTANMVAGHLLLTLLGEFMLGVNMLMAVLTVPLGILLTVLELAVAFIQGYVFMTLFSLYSEELH